MFKILINAEINWGGAHLGTVRYVYNQQDMIVYVNIDPNPLKMMSIIIQKNILWPLQKNPNYEERKR